MTEVLEIPTEPPVMTPLKLITMTINSNIDVNLNLDVVARHTKLNDVIKGISYRDIIRGTCKKKRNANQTKNFVNENFYKSDSISGRFKNQCTFVINVGDKDVNTKVFNNGKMVNVGCKKPEHAIIATEVVRKAFIDMEGLVIYSIPDAITSNNIKKFFKDDLRKKFGDLIQILVCELEIDMNIEPFDNELSMDEAYGIFQDELVSDPTYQSDIMYIYTIINILKFYYDESTILDHFNDPEFQYILTLIINNTDREAKEISCEFPSYLNNKTPIPFNTDSVKIALINKSTNCGYFLNRTVLVDMLNNEPDVVTCTYDKNRYPGVITEYKTSTKNVKIIFFNTGKINITAACTHEQVQQAYDFIVWFCRDKFNRLILKSEYDNKLKEYEDKLPIQHYVGNINDQHYYLLKKSSITSNPRNVRYLSKMKLLKAYREK